VANNSVTVSGGGFWNLGISVSDPENTGTKANLIAVEVRRKIATTSSNFPSATDPIYKSGFNLTSLPFETAWELNSTTNQYTRNDERYVNYLVTAIDPAGNTRSATFSVQNTKSCPPGYIGVPGNSTAGLGNANATVPNANASLDPSREFCVMKYPAKVMSAGTTAAQSTVGGFFEPIMNGNATFANTYTYIDAASFASGITYLPESRSSGTPWVAISRDNAIDACRAQQMQYFGSMPDTITGTGFQLMSNTQWQVVARNAEAQSVNWSNNAVGNGVLNRGHSDNAISVTEELNSWCFGCSVFRGPMLAVSNSVSDSNYYFATGNTATKAWNAQGTSIETSSEQKRTHTLSNGAVIWDMSGNVWQWVNDVRSALGIPAADDTAGMSTNAWYSYLNGATNRFSATGNLIFGNLGSSGLQFSESKNSGQLFGGSAGAVRRGGNWYNTSNSGLFAAALDTEPTGTYDHIGFRCVFLP
jgi:formylglycine-generating enzyme required for sulfatase activity